MIKNVFSSSVLLTVSPTQTSGQTYQSGSVYWDGNTQNMVVIKDDGSKYPLYGTDVYITSSTEIDPVVNWVRKKMKEDADLDKLCLEYPNLDEARKEFAVLHGLLKNQNEQR